ncbi:Nodulation protein D1, lysR family transcriptional regulator [Bradyrhizobium sp. ORS 285]|uniref:LysR family transcriptional regulator n=1 Tax=Bradyrhizobium sp. ORS 285 TaxID=115808 RepID=UPI0002405C66|nr:LysR family transcriptional regulator [Bradyrhizobium sp. ORS 285]CCA64472.1 Nodulation protein D1, lysR family transcriptional regulator [Bradyrhizobium sp. ORS 285]CCD87750.1 Nodulation protein D1, lysR family transcriptional regulator [Bradyrhizobium sp. ORS 285]SMX56432.1 Nodulation protein D1, lysR family transcriptional regulator [Bradyrhizobium sp. ORS 285]
MRFKGLDLNLLVALDALMSEGSLTAAARKIHLSQPAMSAALGRLRAYFNDELFIMKGRGLLPTPLARDLAAPTREALLHIHLSIASRKTFDPAKSERCFRVVLSDFATLVFFRSVLARVAREAPGIRVDLIQFDDQPDELLRRGEVDFLIFPEMYMSTDNPSERLFDERLVCVGCQSNERLSKELSIEQFSEMRHVVVRFGRSNKPAIDEGLLMECGQKRRIDIVASSFSIIPPLLLGTDRIATMHSRLAMHFASFMSLRIVELPLPLPEFTEAVQWPELQDSDPASIWMRQIMFEEAERMRSLS